MADTKKIKFISPFLTARYPHISSPDTKGKYATNKFTVKLVGQANDPEVKKFMALIDEAVADLFGKVTRTTHVPYTVDEETGEVVFGTFKTDYKPAVFDGKGKPVGKDVVVGGGSVIRIMGSLKAFDKGVSGNFNQVQIKQLNSFGQCAFDSIEDGYEAEDSDDNDSFEGAAAGGSNSALDI